MTEPMASLPVQNQFVGRSNAPAIGSAQRRRHRAGPVTLCWRCRPSQPGQNLHSSDIAICPVAALRDDPPDEVLILPWNIAEEVKTQLADLTERGVRFVTAVPELRVHHKG